MMIELFVSLSVAAMVLAAPSPLEMPLQSLPAYFASRDQSANTNPILYDKYGAPPDNYPAIIPDPEYYDENITYQNDEQYCSTVSNCPSGPLDPYAPLFAVPDTLGFGFNSDAAGGREWKCNAEVDCFGLNRVPDDLSNDTEVLFLRSFNFTTLRVGDLAVLPPLMKLRIEYSDLATIEPGVFGSQPTLQYLEIIGNPINHIEPASFRELAELTSLELTNNKITSISRSTFLGLDAMTELKIIGNNITQIDDDTFREMPQLLRLNLEDNRISLISRYAFRKLSKLTTLYLNHNMLPAVPTLALREAPALVNLYLTGNPLKTILKSDFKSLDSLQELWLDQCKLTSIAKKTFQGKQIRLLVLSENKLTVVPNLGTMKSLRTIFLDMNPWVCDCEMIRAVKWVRRHTLSSHSEVPQCEKPARFSGRRATTLTNVELCPKLVPGSALTNTTTALIPRDRDVAKPPLDEELELPEGGWSTRVYDTQLLYTNAEFGTVASPLHTTSRPASSHYSSPSAGGVITKYLRALQTTAEISATAREATTTSNVEVSSRDVRRESSSTGAFGGSGEIDPTTTAEIQTDHSTRGPAVPESTNPTSPPTEGNSAFGAIIGVVAFFLLILALGALLFKVFAAKRTAKEEKKEQARQIELHQPSNGSTRGAEQPHTDQNGNAPQKADKPVDETPSNQEEEVPTENDKVDAEGTEAVDAENDADAMPSTEVNIPPSHPEGSRPTEADGKEEKGT